MKDLFQYDFVYDAVQENWTKFTEERRLSEENLLITKCSLSSRSKAFEGSVVAENAYEAKVKAIKLIRDVIYKEIRYLIDLEKEMVHKEALTRKDWNEWEAKKNNG